jgi:hypothetical protein
MVENFVKETFEPLLNTTFRVSLGAQKAPDLELIEVSDLKIKNPKNFSLIFRGPNNVYLPQQSYTFEHDALGAFELFITPVGRDEEGTYFEAIFNRVLKSWSGREHPA